MVYLSLPANNPATGEPAISGTAQAGQALTADASPILDTDGLTGVDFTYQWLRVDADGTSNPADITDATDATYTLTAADAGKKVKVKVSFTDELSGEEERTSAAYPSSGTVIASTNTTAPALLSVTVTSTPRKESDTYGAREHIEFSMTFDAPVTVTGDPTFPFDLGGATTATWYAGSGTTTLRFSHAVTGGSSGDRDTNGISWAANAIALNGGTIAGTYNAVAAVLTHAAQSNLAAHKVDGRTTPVTPATVTDVVVTSTPMLMASGSSTADTYGFGETIVITVTVSEAVEVEGDPGFRFNIGNPGSTGNVVEATYDRTRSTATAMAFVYTVQAADMDTNGFWIGPHSQTFLLDANDRIRTASQQINIDRSHTEKGTQGGHKVDGSLGAPTVPPDPTAPTLVSATATTLTIEWTHPGDGGSPLTRNFIEYRVEGTTDWTNWYRGETPTPVTRAVITNLEAETAYEVRVHSTNAIGNSQWVQSATAFSTLADGAATNNAPTAANNTVTAAAGAAYAFEADDFGFADADAGATLASVKIVTLPTPGTLALDGTAVIVDQVVTEADIDDDKLTFTPVAGASGTGYASFTFKVNDGTDDSVSAYTMTIDVAASPASPTVSIAAPTGATDGFLYEFEAATEDLQYQWSLTRVGLTDAALTVDVSVAETGGGDFAADGADTVTFDAGDSTTSYTPITEDDVDEDHGTVTVTVTDGTGYDVDPDAARAALAVRDDDGELVTVTLDPATLTVKEGGKAQFHAEAETEADTFDDVADMARLFGTLTQASVEASTEASTGTGAATAGTDYTALAAETVELPFADFEPGSGGVLRLRVALPGIATTVDEVADPGETFKVKLAAPADQDARIAVSTTAATVTISEGPPDGAIRLCSGTAASTCTDVNEALATRNTQGRVEVINDGEWGTVCDDYWSNGDGQVACTQMGYAGAERVFWNSHFGGAVKGTRTWLDNLQCAGDEDDLFDCPRLGGPAVGDHNCNGGGRHVEDAGVRCLAANTAAMGAPTITGTAQVGETLTAATTGITDANGLTSPTYTYQWIRANGTEADIASANSSTYILVAADLGKTIKVKVSFEDDASNAETLTSAATATVVAAPTAPMVTDVDVTSMPASDDTYGTGEMIRYTVTFDQAVTVVGAPEFEFCLGSSGAGSCEVGMPPPTRRRAPLSSGSGTTMLVFSYTVVEGDMDDNGIWAGDQDRTIKLEGGTIQGTVGGLDAVLTHTVVGTEADHKVNGAAANTAPTAANNTVTTGVGAAYTFEADDFGFADTDAGAALASVKIVTVPAAGALALDGTAVLANAVVTKAQIDGGMLTFTPVAGASGTGYASFTFKVNDGTDDSVSAYTMTIDVAAGPTVSIAAPAGATDGFLYEFEAATEDLQYQWSLTRVGLTDEELTVDVSVAETGGGDFAADGADTVMFAVNKSAVSYTPITKDDVDEDHGTVTVTVDAGTGYAVDPDAASAEVDVRDDDGELVTVTLDPATLTVKEGRQAQLHAEAETEEGTFDDAADMTRLFGTVTQAQAIVSTEASTGDSAATAGTDYTALAATTVMLPFADFAAGSGGVLRSRVALPGIATAEDEVTDPGETFEVKLAAPADQDARIAVSTTAATVTINEGPPGGAIRLCSGTAASTCTDVSEALATRNTQGRVEVINDGVWGTVCDDYWSNDDGQVACTQMGFAGAERVFWNSHFGGAAKGTRTWLDNLRCVGDEKDLFDCPRRGGPAVGDHNCNAGGRHVEDAGVRCLAAETAAHGAKVDPLTLTIAPGRTGRYWVSLTKDPEAEVLVYPKLNTEAMAAPEVTEGPLRFPKDQWSYALDVDVTVNAGTALGTYTVTHTMVARKNPVEKSNVTFTVPAVTVKVAASTSVTGPAPVSATVSGRDASVRFDAPLDASFAPSAADFAVLADGRRLALTGAWTAGRALLLELAEPATGAVRLAYVPSAAAPLGGRDGSAVAPFETLALAAPGELADDAPDTLTADAEPKLEGAPGLEAALADALRHAPGPVAATLAAPRRAVADLTGLGAVPQLRRVNLAGNAVTDAGPLALLGDLERLDLSDNAVEDLWPLSGLAELRVLDLSGNRVTDVTALAGLPRLRALELSGNAVVDLSPLGALPALEYLGLSGNRVTDVTALADLHALTRLDLGGNAVADAAPLGDVGRLVWLRLSGNRLATLDGLGRLTKLRWVWVADNPLPDGATVVWPERAWVDVAADRR